MTSIRKLRASSKNVTKAMCETAFTERYKFYDAKCPGLLVAVSPTAPATFFVKCKSAGQRRTIRLGIYHPTDYTIETARIDANLLKSQGSRGIDVAKERRREKAHASKLSATVDQIIDERIEWMKTLVRKHDGEMRPRIESWEGVDRIFDRFVRPRLGKMAASDVTARHVATLSDDIANGKLGKPSISNARQVRGALSGLFRWAAQPSRGYVNASPCVNLEPLDREPPRTRRLSPDEIKVLWRGLDRPDVRWDRRTCLAIKLCLVTALRSTELLHIHRDELVDIDGKFPRVDIAARRVKKRRVIHQPLSGLAASLINEAMGDDQFVFTGRFGDAPLARNAMANALAGTWRIKNGKKVVKSLGIRAMLGLKPFTPHDLRRSAASLMGSIGVPRSTIAACLDHAASDDQGGAVPRVTGVYDQDPRLKEKREALERLAAEIRRIVGEPVEGKGVDMGQRLAA